MAGGGRKDGQAGPLSICSAVNGMAAGKKGRLESHTIRLTLVANRRHSASNVATHNPQTGLGRTVQCRVRQKETVRAKCFAAYTSSLRDKCVPRELVSPNYTHTHGTWVHPQYDP